MANEFVHATVGNSLTQLEFEAVGLHVLNSQATGDLIYASSSSQLSRLAIGAADTVLTCNGTIPSWAATPILNTAVAKGTWTASGTWTIPAVTLGGNMTITGYAFNAGAGSTQINTTGAAEGLKIQSTNDSSNGARLTGYQISASPTAGDTVFSIFTTGKDSGGNDYNYHVIEYNIESPTDGTEAGNMRWRMGVGAAFNTAMTLSSAGVLAVDLGGSGSAAQVDLFDDYDDAIVIKQGIQENNRELLADMGVLERKDSGSGYMMKLQPMVRLLAGGIYQSRQLIDETKDELVSRIEGLENKLLLLGER